MTLPLLLTNPPAATCHNIEYMGKGGVGDVRKERGRGGEEGRCEREGREKEEGEGEWRGERVDGREDGGGEEG